jgi:hypothetical protein
VSLSSTADKLRAEGVETVGVIATAADRARRYFAYRRPRYLVAADPDLVTHRAFGVPGGPLTDEIMAAVNARVEDLARDCGHRTPPGAGWEALDREDGIERGEFQADFERHQAQLIAQFLIDRDGIVRWVNVECERDGLEGLDRLPTDEEVLEAARLVAR